jgi:hypothetical protein
MAFRIHKQYSQMEFKPGGLSKTFRTVCKQMGIQATESLRFQADYAMGSTGHEERELTITEIGSITELRDTPRELRFGYNWSGTNIEGISIYGSPRGLRVSVSMQSAERAQEMVDILEQGLGLLPLGNNESSKKANQGDHAIKSDVPMPASTMANSLRCFISYRFDANAEAYVMQLKRFLALVGITAQEASGYEPRAIPDKVLEKLSDKIDILIYLITTSGESTWTRDELSFAYGKGAHVVPLLEKGCSMDEGLLGKAEFIEFDKGHIGDSFIKILEAIAFTKSRRAKQSRGDA